MTHSQPCHLIAEKGHNYASSSSMIVSSFSTLNTEPGHRLITEPGHRLIIELGHRLITAPGHRVITEPGHRASVKT